MGAEIGEIEDMNGPVLSVGAQGSDHGTAAFLESWRRRAELLISQAEHDVERHRRLSASSKYRRASIYLMTAERMQGGQHAERESAYRKMLETTREAVLLSGEQCEYVEIPFEGSAFPGMLVKADSKDGRPAPCMVHTNGLDSVKEMIYWCGIAQELKRRGVSTLMIDQPGVGEALRLRGLHGVYDSERWAAAAYDYLVARNDMDANAIGIMGWSLGGYFAPRAAAYEPRFALCVAWGANNSWGRLQARRLESQGENPVPHYWEHVMWVFGNADLESFLEFADHMNLDGVIERIRVPFLIVHGENDRQIPVTAAYESYKQAINSPNRQLRVFTTEDGGVEHVSADNQAPAKEFISDWIAETFREVSQSAETAGMS